MRTLLDLALYEPGRHPLENSWSTFFGIAREMDVSIRHIEVRDGERVPEHYLEDRIEEADAFIARIPTLIGNSYLSPLIHRKIQSGTPLIAMVKQNFMETQNEFLERYGVRGTRIGLFARPDSSEARDVREVVLNAQRNPGCFRDPRLFRGVEELRLNYVHAIRTSKSALPVLAIPKELAFIVDTETDRVHDWPSLELACVSVTEDHESDLFVVSVGSQSFVDGEQLPDGNWIKGIQAADNVVFARNLIGSISKVKRTASVPDPYALVKKIEEVYFDITRNVLLEANPSWWTLVPESVSSACEQRRLAERDEAFSASSYMDLLHIKKIWSHHWVLFEPTLRHAGYPGGKSTALKHFQRLNGIRKLVAHPLKMRSSGVTLDHSDLHFLQDHLQRAIRASAAVYPLRVVK